MLTASGDPRPGLSSHQGAIVLLNGLSFLTSSLHPPPSFTFIFCIYLISPKSFPPLSSDLPLSPKLDFSVFPFSDL